MTFWVILSWVFVLLLTGINVFIFLKLKSASDQMMKMAFPGMDMGQAMQQMQRMMSAMQGGGGRRGGNPFGGMPAGGRGNANMDAQLKAAMDMLQQMKKGSKK